MGDEERTAKTWRESLGDGQLEGDRWYHVLFKGLFPGSLYLLAIGVIGAIYGSDMVGEWTNLTFLFLVPPMGTGALIPLGMSKGFSPLTMALTVTLVDAIMAMYVVWWLVLLKKIPGLGKAFNWIEEKAGKKVESDPRMKRGSWMVIYMSLLIPVQGSGGINMAVIGRVLGLRADSIVSAIVAGSFSIAVITAFMASVGMSLLQESLVGFIIFIMLMVQALVITILLKNRYQMRKWEAELARTP